MDERFITFSQPTPLTVFAVPPGHYQIQQLIVKSCSGIEADRKDFLSPLIAGVIEVKPLTATYLGDYAAQTFPSVGPGGLTKQMVFMSRQCRNFTVTTEKFNAGWSNLSRLESVDATTRGPACVQPVS